MTSLRSAAVWLSTQTAMGRLRRDDQMIPVADQTGDETVRPRTSGTAEPTGWMRHPKTGRRRDGDPGCEYIQF